MRIVAFCITDSFSGAEKYTLELLRELAAGGFDVAVVGGRNSHELRAKAALSSVPYISSDLGPKLSRRSALVTSRSLKKQAAAFRKLTNALGADLVLLQFKLEQILWAGSGLDARVAILEHGPIPAAVRFIPFLRARYIRSAKASSHLFAVSRPAKAQLQRLLPGRKVALLPPGVSTRGDEDLSASIEGRLSEFRARFGLEKLVFYAGRMTASKGVGALLDYSMLQARTGVVLAGTGPLVNKVLSAEATGAKLLYLGQVDNVEAVIRNIDVGVILTTDPGEGSPLFVMECLSLGIPVVGEARSLALRSLADRFPANVKLVRRGDVQAFSEAIHAVERARPVHFSWQATASILRKEVL